jgi:hypothetical protein
MLKQISAYGISLIVLHIVDKSEMLLDLNYEKCVVEDVEDKSLSVTTDVQEIKELYQKEFEELVSFYKQSLNTNNISYYFIDTSLPIIQNLEIVLGQK